MSTLPKILTLTKYPSNMQKPKGWRNGQTMFNFLEWIGQRKGVGGNQNARMADPFHISDEEWDAWYAEFLAEMGK